MALLMTAAAERAPTVSNEAEDPQAVIARPWPLWSTATTQETPRLSVALSGQHRWSRDPSGRLELCGGPSLAFSVGAWEP